MIGRKVYKIGTRRSASPVIGRPDEGIPELERASYEYDLDKGLAVMKHLLVEDNPVNRHFVLKNESVAQSFMDITGMTIVGDGITTAVPNNQRAQNCIQTFNASINIRHDTIDDYIVESWKDNIENAGCLYRHALVPELPCKIDMQRVDQRTLKVEYDKKAGWRRWVQKVTIDKYRRQHFSRKEFYKEPYVRFGATGYEAVYVVIPDEPSSCLFISHFTQPPVTAAMNLLKYKIWILWFMRKYSEKHWAPFLIGSIGDTKNNFFPYSEQELQDEIDKMSAALGKVRDFSSIAIPGYNSVEALKTETAKSSQIYVEYLKHLNEEIMYALFGSMGQRTSSGNYIASSSVIDEAWLRFIRGIRRNYDFALKRFYAHTLLPLNGIFGVVENDISIEWSHMRTESLAQTMQALKDAAEIGVFNDRQELRDIAEKYYPKIGENKAGSEKGYVPESVSKPVPAQGQNAPKSN